MQIAWLAPLRFDRVASPSLISTPLIQSSVPRHRGIYYRPRVDGKIAPPYEVFYIDSAGKQRWETVDGSLEDAEARRPDLRLRRRKGERIAPTRQTFGEYARDWLDRQHV